MKKEEKPENDQAEHLVTPDEAWCLVAYHTYQGDYARDCKATQVEIANKEPLHKFGDMQTKEDWLNYANELNKKRLYHRARARYWKTQI